MSRCQGRCGKKIDKSDILLIKSYGTTTWTDKKSGKEMSKHGPMYIHFNEICLKAYHDKFYGPSETFEYSIVTVGTETLSNLSEEEKKFLKELGVKL